LAADSGAEGAPLVDYEETDKIALETLQLLL
jgi:hypothetical protein